MSYLDVILVSIIFAKYLLLHHTSTTKPSADYFKEIIFIVIYSFLGNSPASEI